MNKQITYFFILTSLLSCNKKEEKSTNISEKKVDSTVLQKAVENPIKQEQELTYNLPQWVLNSNVIATEILNINYKIDSRLQPAYLEEDFNGDGHLDVAFPISETKNDKKGFAVVHGKTFEVFILGAGKMFKNALDDNQDYIDLWRINRKKENDPGVEEETGNGENGILILENPSIEIDNTEVGGGQIYWNGKEYAYFHQTY